MKKTVKNMMAAAVFAAAMGTLPTGTAETAGADYNPQGEVTEPVYGPPAVTTTVQPVYGTVPYWTTTTEATTMQTVYGTVPYWTTAAEATTVQPVYGTVPYWTTETAATTTVTETVPAPVYGPPIAWKGDLIADNRIDVFDMIEMRKKYLNAVLYGDYDSQADINDDGEVNVADVVMLQKYILGTAKSFSVQDTAAASENNGEN